MDTIFVLGQESRQRILHRAAARLPGCAYVCAWAPLPLPAAGLHHHQPPPPPPSSGGAAARLLYCVDGWLSGGEDGGGVRALFDAYRGSVCGAVTGCVPGWAYVGGGGAFMELSELELVASASLPVQQSFYQEAGIKVRNLFHNICFVRVVLAEKSRRMKLTWAILGGVQMAAFMGCESGEIEVGFSTAPAENYGGGAGGSLQASVEQVFSEDFFQQSLLEELLQLPPTRPSSSSSSLVGSPADGAASTSLLRTMTPMMASSSATPSPRELAAQVATTPSSSRLHPRPPAPHHVHVSPFSRHGGGVLHFPSAEADDAAMAQAMLDVISSPSTSSSAAALHAPWSSVKRRAQIIRSPPRGTPATTTAFRAYNAALAPRAAASRRPPGAPGQRMIKMGFSILRRMHMVRCSQERAAAASAAAAQRSGGDDDEDATAAPPPPTSSQLHHMISERRRRERLNESFEHLRGLLPPGSKKDKATVLAKTLEYMNLLIAQISELEAKNRALQTQIHQRANGSSSSRSSMIRTVNEVHHHHHHQWLAVAGAAGSPERVQVHVIGGGDHDGGTSTSSSSAPEVTVRVAVRARERGGADVSELVLRVLALLKAMGGFTVVAVDARQPGGGGNGGAAQASLTLRATAGEFDEASLKEAVAKAVESLVAPPPPPPP
uniref:BHLH domain-containing protein n=1 Tax=Oryza meridionalis TaxID=40149 RepID=A0A0E0CI27_9ORYZ